MLTAIALALVVAPAVAGQPSAPEPISWAKIVWHAETLRGKTMEHAALLLEMRLEGLSQPVLMQLDTGCDVNLVYELAYEGLGELPALLGRKEVALSGSVGGSRFESERFHVRRERAFLLNRLLQSIAWRIDRFKGKPILFGTLGAAFLERRVLLLDFVGQRAAILPPRRPLPAALARRVDFASLNYRDRKIFIPVQVNGVTHHDLCFDTGSSALPIATTRSRWAEWTGSQVENPSNTRVAVQSWGKYVELVGAPVRGPLCVRSACMSGPLAYFEPTGVPNLAFERYPFSIGGVIGNALFDGRFTVVLDLPQRRFGLAGSVGY